MGLSMKVLIRHRVSVPETVFQAWAAEHAAHYGTPWAHTKALIRHHVSVPRTVYSEWAAEHAAHYGIPYENRPGCGLIEGAIAKRLFLGELLEEGILSTGLIRDIIDNPDVMTPRRPAYGWMTSGGNLTLVAGDLEYRSGRRHGVRIAAPTVEGDDEVLYYSTTRPDLSPDATASER